MHEKKLHLHSMLVHPVLALVPVAAVAFVLAGTGSRIGSFGPGVWRFLVTASLALVLLLGLLATASGVLERGHMYATWHLTHKLKLTLSLVLVALAATGLALLVAGDQAVILSPAGVMIVILGPIVAFFLSALGLKMTLGRQSLARTSYVPDLFQQPPVDIVALTAAGMAEPPDFIDVMGELAS
jgi:hypothetical protein